MLSAVVLYEQDKMDNQEYEALLVLSCLSSSAQLESEWLKGSQCEFEVYQPSCHLVRVLWWWLGVFVAKRLRCATF